jgi:hypothetical protein
MKKADLKETVKARMTPEPVTTSAQTSSVLEEAAQLSQRLEALQAAEASAQALLAKSEAALAASKRAFASATAAKMVIAPNGHLPKGLREEDAMQEAEADLRQAELAVLGCRRASAALDREALVLREKLRGEVEYHRESQAREFLHRHADLIRQYKQFLTDGQALADALGIKLTLTESHGKPPHPLATAILDLPAHEPWNQNPESTALYHQHSAPHTWLRVMERLSGQAEYRAKKPEYFPPDEVPVPRTRYVLKQPLLFNGVTLKPGTRISAFSVPSGMWGVLAKLAATRHIAPVEIE